MVEGFAAGAEARAGVTFEAAASTAARRLCRASMSGAAGTSIASNRGAQLGHLLADLGERIGAPGRDRSAAGQLGNPLLQGLDAGVDRLFDVLRDAFDSLIQLG